MCLIIVNFLIAVNGMEFIEGPQRFLCDVELLLWLCAKSSTFDLKEKPISVRI